MISRFKRSFPFFTATFVTEGSLEHTFDVVSIQLYPIIAQTSAPFRGLAFMSDCFRDRASPIGFLWSRDLLKTMMNSSCPFRRAISSMPSRFRCANVKIQFFFYWYTWLLTDFFISCRCWAMSIAMEYLFDNLLGKMICMFPSSADELSFSTKVCHTYYT